MAETKCETGCPGCAERDERLAAAQERVAELEAELAKARKNSANSSKPPSSDITNPQPNRGKRGRRKKRKSGGQPGHARNDRRPIEEHELDKIWEWRYPSCPCCSGPLVDAEDPPQRKLQQIELGQQPVSVEEHRSIGQWCSRCQKQFVPRLPKELIEAGLVGPRLSALVGWFKGVCHMSIS